jgi:hypothetical protein
MNTGRSGRGGSALVVWPTAAAMLVGVAVGMALPRPFELARAAQPPTQGAAVPVPFPGAQPPATGESAPADDAAAAAGPATEDQPPVATLTFDAPAGMFLNFIRPASANAFEALTRRLVQALAASEDPERQAQAAGWRLYRVQETGTNNNTVFVWFLDPAVPNANYAIPQLLNEMFPAEVQQLYEGYNQSFGVGQLTLNLQPVVLLDE